MIDQLLSRSNKRNNPSRRVREGRLNTMSWTPFSIGEIAQIHESYGRCLDAVPDLYGDFYDRLMASDPDIPQLFQNTDLQKQKQRLKHGILGLILYAEGHKFGPAAVENLGVMHDRHHANVAPRLYDIWIDTFLDLVAQADTRMTEELMILWQRVLRHGTREMARKF